MLNNEAIHDNWWEFEWKIKGEIARPNLDLDWSFRIGGKWHENVSIADTYYVGVRRDHIDVKKRWISFLDNSGVDLFFEFGQDERAPTQQRAFIFKNIPLENSKRALRLSFGLIRTTERRYRAPLQENTNLQLVITPSIKF